MFQNVDFHRFTLALLGALALSTACVTAAVAPVNAASITATRY